MTFSVKGVDEHTLSKLPPKVLSDIQRDFYDGEKVIKETLEYRKLVAALVDRVECSNEKLLLSLRQKDLSKEVELTRKNSLKLSIAVLLIIIALTFSIGYFFSVIKSQQGTISLLKEELDLLKSKEYLLERERELYGTDSQKNLKKQ